MKLNATKKSFPNTDSEWQALIAAAPGRRRAPSAQAEKELTERSVMVTSGGHAAVREALAAKRRPGQRGPQKTPTKERVALRLSKDVLAHFRSEGAGWQSRIDETLKAVVTRKQTAQTKRAGMKRS
jgi:uncharacterized protein (DUF4415 family)